MSIIELVAAALFALALIHSFSTSYFQRLEQRHPKHAGLFHLLGEVELVFGFWSVLLIAAMAWLEGPAKAIGYAESRQYTEPLFVFVIMVIAASRPVVSNIEALIASMAQASRGETMRMAELVNCSSFQLKTRLSPVTKRSIPDAAAAAT